MSIGKTIELFLVDGSAEGIVTAELSNWSGKAIRIPRVDVTNCDREDIRNAGVYFLICEDESGKDSVYIGEGENVYTRLQQHLMDFKSGKEKYYWNTAVVFIGRDLNKAFIRYLENRFVEIAKECGRYTVLTKNTYKNTVMKESHIAIMEEFIGNVLTLLSALGYSVLTPAPKAKSDTTMFYIKNAGVEAKGFLSGGGFTVVAGSIVSKEIKASLVNRPYGKLRGILERDRIIVDNIFVQDYEFTSPSAASNIVLGFSSSGNEYWKTKAGKKLKDFDI